LDEIFCIRDLQYCNKILTNGVCPDHGAHAYGKEEVISITKSMLAICEKSNGRADKYKISRELLNFIGRNKTFLKSHGKFCNMFYKKYLEFFDMDFLTIEQHDGLVESFLITFSTEHIEGGNSLEKFLSHPIDSIYH